MFKPLKNRVLIERDESKTEVGGLVIPTEYQEKETFGNVIAVGPSADDAIQVGQRVLFGKHDGVEISESVIGRKGDFILVRDDQVRAVIS